MISPVGMFFRQSNRLKSKNDKETLKRFKRVIFDNDIPVSQIIGRYFKTVKELKTRYNIAYMNSTCQMVSEEVRSRLLKKERAVRNKRDARTQVVVQAQEASLQRETTNTTSRRWRGI